MIRILMAIALACAPAIARAESPDNFLVGIRSINVVMHRDRGAWSKRYIVFASHFGCGKVWYNKADAMVASPEQCRRYAKDYGDGVSASCYSAGEFRALSRNLGSHCSKNMNPH